MAEKRTEEGKRRRRLADLAYYHSVKKHQPGYREGRRNYYFSNYYKIRKQTRDSQLQKKFGISWDDYALMYEAQDGLCAICNGTNKDRLLAVDHCHVTGKVRGLLCGNCNLGLGNFQDSPILLDKAKEYLLG